MLIDREISIKLAPREDGGIRVWSDDLLGLILSHWDQEAALQDLGTAIVELRKHQMTKGTTPKAVSWALLDGNTIFPDHPALAIYDQCTQIVKSFHGPIDDKARAGLVGCIQHFKELFERDYLKKDEAHEYPTAKA